MMDVGFRRLPAMVKVEDGWTTNCYLFTALTYKDKWKQPRPEQAQTNRISGQFLGHNLKKKKVSFHQPKNTFLYVEPLPL